MLNHHIHYIRNANGVPVGCVAFRDVYGKDTLIHVEYGFSVHNPSDTWNRKLARQIAIGRMVESPFRIKGDPTWNISRTIQEVVMDISRQNVPKRIKREASRSPMIDLPF